MPYFKLRDGVLWRKQEGSLVVLDPATRGARFYNVTESRHVDDDGVITVSESSASLIQALASLDVLDEYSSSVGTCCPTAGRPTSAAPAAAVPAPLNVTIQVTNACNLRCGHCHNPIAGRRHMSMSDFTDIVTDLRSMRVLNVNLSGGEPMLHKRIYDMVSLISSLGMKVTMSTNCTFMDAEKASHLAIAGLRQVHVSLDSNIPASHDAMRGRVGAFAKMRSSLRHLTNAEIDYTLVTTLRGQSIEEYGATIDMAHALGATAHKTNTVVPQGRGREVADQVSELVDGYIDEFRQKRVEYHGRMRLLAETMFALQMQPEGDERMPPMLNVGCPAGVLTCAINERGDVLPCSFFSELIAGNAICDGFGAVWERSAVFAALRHRDTDEVCSSCRFSASCGGCRARSFGTYGELHRTDPDCRLGGGRSCAAMTCVDDR